LEAEVNLAMHYINQNRSVFYQKIETYYPDGSLAYTKPDRNSLTESRMNSTYFDNKALVRYSKDIDRHSFSALLGASYEDFTDDIIQGSRVDFLFPNYNKLNSGSTEEQRASGTGTQWALLSYFGRLNYAFDGKYLFEFNLRRDGSSRFVKDHRWGMFPSFSAGWHFAEEGFWQNWKHIVTEGKLRVSHGLLGNQLIGNYPFSSFVDINTYAFGEVPVPHVAGSIGTLGNSIISWEKTSTTNFGLDLSFLNKFSLTADYYQRKTTGILLNLYIPRTIGMNPPTQNAAVVSNRGWEIGIRYNDQIGDFNHSWSFNLSDVKNEVQDMKGVSQTGLTVNHEGYAINSLFGYKTDGYITSDDFDAAGNYTGPEQFGNIAPGDIKYVDLNGDGVITTEDYTIIGSTVPRFTFGLNTDFNYKGFDLGMFWQGVGKVDGYLNHQATMPFYVGGTAMAMHKDRWTPDNTNATFPRLPFNHNNNTQNSNCWSRDASYLRLRNLQFGYRLPSVITTKMGVTGFRVYASGQNLISIDRFWDGYDVEAPVGNGAFYPQLKLYSIGVDITF